MRDKKKFVRFAAGMGLIAVFFSSGCAIVEPKVSQSNAADPMVVEEIMLGDYKEYESLTEALDASELVVIGTPVSFKTSMRYPDVVGSADPLKNPQAGLAPQARKEFGKNSGIVATVTRIRVEKVFHGSARPGEVIEIQQTGGELDGKIFRDPSVTLLNEFIGGNHEILLNLQSTPEQYALVSPKYGALMVSEGKLSGLDGASIEGSLQDAQDFFGSR